VKTEQSTPHSAPFCLAVHDGRAGHARQALTLARLLDPQPRELHLHPRAPWRWSAPHLLPGARLAFDAHLRTALRAPTAVAIGCGRQAALATRLLRRAGSRAVQILDPRLPTRHWDVVIAPEHDAVQGDNVILLQGSLHPVDDDFLLRAISRFSDFALLPAPHIVLLIGGPTRHAPLDESDLRTLLQRLTLHAQAEGGSLSVATSPRTPSSWRATLDTVPASLPGYRWRDERDGVNPYAGLLAHADRLVCTPDSVNLLSEAAATRAPLYLWRPDRVEGRLRRFIDSLLHAGRARPYEEPLAAFPVQPLRETARVVQAVRTRLGLI
jgi:hypothetical protein